jgi:hypothetical protein
MRRWCPVILVALVLAVILAPASPGRPVGKDALPQGNGLAARYKADAGIGDDKQVIFADDFEAGDLSRWDEIRNPDKKVLAFVNESAADPRLGQRSLKVTATLGENTGGGMTKWFEPGDPIYIRFYTKFAADCDYIHHFCTLRANKGLRGADRWSGFGGAGQRPNGDERFSTALEPFGDWGRYPPPGQWNFYSYWHEMKAGRDGKFWGNSFRPDSQENIPRDRWICCEFMVRHNTPGQPDGEQAAWIDGKLLGHWTGINWRTSPTLWANAFTLESYVTDRWTKNKVNVVYFDNVVIAKEYIGPAGHD